MTQKQLHEMFEYKNGQLIYKIKTSRKVKIGDVAGYVNKLGYRQISINYKLYQAHRLIWIMHNGDIETGLDIDHIDRNPSNNRIENLRVSTRSQNRSNSTKQKNNTSGYKGVSWHKCAKKWMACIKHNQIHIHLGLFATPELAHAAYVDAATKLHKDFAFLD